MISPTKYPVSGFKFDAWARSHPESYRAALEVLANAGALPDQIDAFSLLWPAVHHMDTDPDCVPCPRCFMAGRKRWLTLASAGWRMAFVCSTCGYTPYFPPVPADGPPRGD